MQPFNEPTHTSTQASTRPNKPRAGWVQVKHIARVVLIGLTLATTGVMVGMFHGVLAVNGLSLLDALALCLFALLSGLIAFSFWTAVLCTMAVDRSPQSVHRPTPQDNPVGPANLATADDARVETDRRPGRVAVLCPVYNEDPARVFAGVEAAVRELVATGEGARFDVFVLSDTRKPEGWVQEETCWAALAEKIKDLPVGVFYRRRKHNTSRKSGNIEDWVNRWGGSYAYMLVFDADSMMDGPTMLKMARRMDHDSELGILQSPPKPVNRQSLWARLQQFSAAVYGPVCAMGFRLWAEDDGNYWGHNAIIRVDAFAKHCGLPVLPGKAPLGGEILSHDFVEAALMKQAGYKVRLDADLVGSYEECPTNLIDYAVRDQRWCQGNLQHMNLIARKGFHPISRAHLFFGVMSFVAAPLWGAFLLLTLLGAAWQAWMVESGVGQPWLHQNMLGLFVATMVMLLFPKIVGLWDAAAHKPQAHGGLIGLTASVFFETVMSIVVAPVMMAFHSRFVINTLRGKSVQWNAQNRDEARLTWSQAWEAHGWQTILGIGLGALALVVDWTLFLWLSPVAFGLLFAVPISIWLSSGAVGRTMAKMHLLVIEEETTVPRVVSTVNRLTPIYAQHLEATGQGDPVTALIAGDASGFESHLHLLASNSDYTDLPEDGVRIGPAQEALVITHGVQALKREQVDALLQQPEVLRRVRLALRAQKGLADEPIASSDATGGQAQERAPVVHLPMTPAMA